jgi:ABC-type phosphate transport system substrate-binding protein
VRATRALVLSAVLLSATLGGMSSRGADVRGGAGYRMIVNASNPVETVDRRFLTEAFFKKTTRWPNDLLIRPADQSTDSPARRAFSDDVLRRSVAAVKSYWQQMVFSGRGLPPPELDDDAEVVKFVVRNPGAIGYVSPGANVAGAKPIGVR